MKRLNLPGFFIFLLMPFSSLSLEAQNSEVSRDTLRKGAVRIFLDCQSCDMNYTREQINFSNFVRDVKEAQVYILVTQQNAGSGGTQYTFTYQGLETFSGKNDTLVYTTNPDETATIIREKKTRMLKLGLMNYVARTPLFSEVDIINNSELEREQVVDKWNNWVFRLSTEPFFRSEELDKQLEIRNGFNITKVTPDIKVELELDQSYSRRRVIEDEGNDTTYITNELRGDNLIVKSINEHWSAGLKWNVGSSTVENYDFMTDFLPSVEFDLFPYSEATHRQLRFLYSLGYQYNNYKDSTVYNRLKDGFFKQEFNIAFQIQKKWGSINLALVESNFLNDFSKNRIELNTSVNLRIFKGLGLQISGGITRINDQVNLKKGDISEVERLLQLRELSTGYRIEGAIGLTYTFGSIYNNVVNPRFGFGGGGMMPPPEND
jgi:hypothetical protein